jgi:hypothetical protein
LPDLCDGEFCREGISFVQKVFHRNEFGSWEAAAADARTWLKTEIYKF